MEKGPFGAPRPLGVGPFVNTREIDEDDIVSEGLKDDVWFAIEEGDKEDFQRVIEAYDGTKVNEEDGLEYYRATEDGTPMVVVYEGDGASVKPFNEWVHGSWTWDKGMEDFLDIDPIEEFNENFWRSPETLAHATDPNSAVQIILSGALEGRWETRGTGNRSVGKAVFTSQRPGDAIKVYGDVQFLIDTASMKDDDFTPLVTQEPQVREERLRKMIADMFYVHDYFKDIPHDVSEDTIIVHDDIPKAYLSLSSGHDAVLDAAQKMYDSGTISETDLQTVREWVGRT